MLIDARARFTVARAAATAKRLHLARGEAETAIDIEFLDAELRNAMATGLGFDFDGRVIET